MRKLSSKIFCLFSVRRGGAKRLTDLTVYNSVNITLNALPRNIPERQSILLDCLGITKLTVKPLYADFSQLMEL